MQKGDLKATYLGNKLQLRLKSPIGDPISHTVRVSTSADSVLEKSGEWWCPVELLWQLG